MPITLVRALAVGAAALAACALAACTRSGGAPAGNEVMSSSAEPAPSASIPDELVIRVTGRDYRWHLCYPGADGILGTDDDVRAERDIHVPANTRVRLELASEDYMYQLGVPDLGVREIAVPDLEFAMEFGSGPPGKHRVEGDQFCGFSHPDLFADLVVLEPSAYGAWVAAQR